MLHVRSTFARLLVVLVTAFALVGGTPASAPAETLPRCVDLFGDEFVCV